MSTTTMTTSTWPAAAPLAGEEAVISIFIGNDRLHWAAHYGEEQAYNPFVVWSSAHVTNEDFEKEDEMTILSRIFLDTVPTFLNTQCDYIFGKTTNKAPISVYVVSSDSFDQHVVQEGLLARMWNAVPSRFFVLGKDAFFTNEDTMKGTVNQLAILTGAVHLHGHPALVFHALPEKAVTYSATDCHGKILSVGAAIAFNGHAFNGRNIIQEWLGKSNFSTPHGERRVFCTGKYGNMMKHILQPEYEGGGVIEHYEDVVARAKADSRLLLNAPQYMVVLSECIIHYGIACVLVKQVNSRRREVGEKKSAKPTRKSTRLSSKATSKSVMSTPKNAVGKENSKMKSNKSN